MKSRHIFAIAAVLFLATLVAAQQPGEFSEDPYLQYRPPFVRSLPVQILLTGVVLTLTVVLFIHLMFTAQYHWPLAPVNYVLQISGVTTLLISLIATIHVVLSTSWSESENWPYMLSYIAVNVPPLEFQDQTEVWSIAEKATWLVMTASTSGLIQITHIQFLTLLYPSRLEKQLIFALLGPMAIVAAVMQLIPINSNPSVTSVSTAVRNVCNATLSLLFTVALFIWGLLVNRKQAWRTDGGTAAFGCGALILALVSTTLNLIYVHRQDEYVWLPGLMWAVVLWQSFLGWWWWVGAGSGSGLGDDNEDMEEKLRREAKRETRRREARARRQETRKRAKKVWRDVTGAFARELQQDSSSDAVVAVSTATGAGATAGQSSSAQSRPGSSIAASRIRTRLSPERRPSSSSSRSRSRRRPTTSDSPPTSPVRSVVSSSSISSSSGTSLGTLPRLLPAAFHRFYASVRRAHLLAAQKQAAERVERIREMERNGVPDTSRSGWGVSNLVWRTRSGRAAAAAVSKGREPDTDVEGGETGGGGGGEYEMYERNEWRRERSSRNRREDEEGTVAVDQVASEEEEEEEEAQEVETRSSSREIRRQEQDQRRADVDGDGDGDRVDTSDTLPTTQNRPIPEDNRPKSFWWWGPLGRWRLQDSTTYS